ncbi:hypothetical protein PU629_10530 [Pullulanibacillus sp. KACC 23026]|uniref:hypothetical protein n=1 Tax=Pullulanibacillus sp. KACC 23026 TaxID=3028315 RepID=UPI0023AFB590|nr:hypothetical protein [Pullulanibacillus sp. KACC 23026]WEG14748.1 hypothetical protein PU629_10530 [Pullulanibacillus sp. KACC 23026]
MKTFQLDGKRYMKLARTAVSEGAVLLKNENETLPIKAGTRSLKTFNLSYKKHSV